MTPLSGQALTVAFRDDELDGTGSLVTSVLSEIEAASSAGHIARRVANSLRDSERTAPLTVPANVAVALQYAKEAADRIRRNPRIQRSGTDGWLAERLHWSLRLGPRDAGRPGLWAALMSYPEFSDYALTRWPQKDRSEEDSDGSPLIARLVGKDWNRHALARLWWMAELTRDGPDYRPVHRAFEGQDFMNQAGRSLYARNRSFFSGWMEATLDFWHDPDVPVLPDFGVRERIRWASAGTQMALAGIVLDAAFPDSAMITAADWRDWIQSTPGELPDSLDDPCEGPQFGRVEGSTAQSARRWTSSLYREYVRGLQLTE